MTWASPSGEKERVLRLEAEVAGPCTPVLRTRAGLGLLESGKLCAGLPHLRGARGESG